MSSRSTKKAAAPKPTPDATEQEPTTPEVSPEAPADETPAGDTVTITDAAGTPIAEVTVESAAAADDDAADEQETAPVEATETETADDADASEPTTAEDETAETPDDTDEQGGDPLGEAPAPITATLDVPVVVEPVIEPEDTPSVASAGIARVLDRPYVFDDQTGQTPNPDTLFVRPAEHASSLICTRRLIEQVPGGAHTSPLTRLLLPAGIHVSEHQANVVLRLVRAQLADAAEAETPTE